MDEEIWLLDGGMGTELRMRGVEVPDHLTSIWSAQALLDAPEAVLQVHRDYIDAGADVITLNNYAVTRPLLERAGLQDRCAEMTSIAIELAQSAREGSNRPIRIAGSLPPLNTSYRPKLVAEDERLLRDYREITQWLSGKVDILLCETLSCAREARAAVMAASEVDLPVWLSWTLQGNQIDCLPSGETLVDAYGSISDFDVEVIMVNCCGANFVTSAIPTLVSLGVSRCGGYANTADVHAAGVDSEFVEPELVDRTNLDVDAYVASAMEWIDRGASVVGGCCSTRPVHIASLREAIDARTGLST